MRYDADWYNSVGRNQVIDWNTFKFDVEPSGAKNVPSPDNGVVNYYKEYLNMIKQQNAAANALSVEEAQKNRDFQMEMSNTAHQREVADLKAAGLNPVLSANNSGAPMASGATAAVSDSSGAVGSIASAAIGALASIANTQANNAKDIAINQKSLDLQEMLGLKNLDLQEMLGLKNLGLQEMLGLKNIDLQKYGIDVGRLNSLTAASASNYAANISKLNTELSNNAAYERLVEQGDIDLAKIHTTAEMDILKSIFSGSGVFGEKDYVNAALAAGYLYQQGIVDARARDEIIAQAKKDPNSQTRKSGGRGNSHHR